MQTEIEEKPWKPIAPSAIALGRWLANSKAMSILEINELIKSYVNSAKEQYMQVLKILEIHAAHGYLIHSFYLQYQTKEMMIMEEIMKEE